MKKIDINALIQLLGMVGIIISLIFVGLEMQQTQRIAIASAQEARMNANRGYIRSMQESNLDAQSVFWEQKFDYDSDETTLPSSSASSSTSTGDIPSAHDVLKKIYLGNKLSAKDVHEMQLCDSAFVLKDDFL